MSGDGSTSTPPTPSTSSAPVPPVSPFLKPTPGIRYPLYATVQGSPLLYSFPPAMLGPWRAMGTPTTKMIGSSEEYTSSAPGTSQSAPPSSQNAMIQNLTPLPQLPGLIYSLPTLGMPMLSPQQQTSPAVSRRASAGQSGETTKRRSETSRTAFETDSKRPKISESTPNSPNLTSTPHTGTPSPSHTIPGPTHSQQRSPVIKFIPYNPGQSMVLPSSVSSQAMPPSLSQTLLLPTLPSLPTTTATQGGEASHGQKLTYKLPATSLPNKLCIVLLKCFGPIPEGIISQNNLAVSNLLQDLYRPSYFTTSNYTDPPLSPESCALLTICYLNALRPGELINIESLRAMMHCAQLGEIEWLHYYKKHKKMSESTFVQSQLMHLSRISVYPVLGKVRVMMSNQSLGEGVTVALHNLAHLSSISKLSLPDYVVVLAIRPSATIDFCVLVLDALQVRLLKELESVHVAEGRGKRGNRRREEQKNSQQRSTDTVTFHLNKDLLIAIRSFQRKLKDNVLIPFYHTESVQFGIGMGHPLPSSKAESLVPSAPHIIEHKPLGPFQDQYSIAMYMLQKVIGGWGTQMKIDEYKQIDFRVLCPPDESFVRQTVREVVVSGLVEYLEVGVTGGMHKEVERRVIRCNSPEHATEFASFLEEVEASPSTLYVVAVEMAHLTSSIGNDGQACLSDNRRLLCSLPNCILIYVSSQPYLLQTNRSLISYANEIHWPQQPHPQGSNSHTHFCTVADYQSDQWDYGVRFTEDEPFEELFQKTYAALGPAASVTMVTVRMQLLLNQYCAALLSATLGHPPTPPPLPETQGLVNSLVHDPLSSARGYGPMVVIRCHHVKAGQRFYRKLRAVRDTLGLRYRFEMIFDDGSKPITVSEHFTKRLAQWKRRGGSHGNLLPGHVTSYRELENLPCIVVLAGLNRSGLGFPSSLSCVDLRLCSSPVVTRATYEYDTSLLNGHRVARAKRGLSEFLASNSQESRREEAMETGGDESDSDVFEDTSLMNTSSQSDHHDKPSSSSSTSCKSSYDNEEEKAVSPKERTTVEWRPVSDLQNGNGTPKSMADNGERSVMVVINPPEEDNRLSHQASFPAREASPSPFLLDREEEEEEKEEEEEEEEEEELLGLEELESDSEGEEGDSPVPSCVCLLSRQYFHIWSSRSPQTHLLLPPSPGVDWHGGHRRPPLFDQDPQQQSAYYRKWSKPAEKEVKVALDGLTKESSKGSRRRYLLTGPSQVGKTGAWLLMVRLLHDHLRSSQGVVVENPPISSSIFLSRTSEGNELPLLANSAPVDTTSPSCSPIVPLGYLQAIAQLSCEENDKKPDIALLKDSPQSQAEFSLSTANSVNCAKYLRGSLVAHPEVLTSLLPTEQGGHITLQWHVPTYQQKHCVISPDRKTLERLKLATLRLKGEKAISHPLSPIFTPTLGRESSGLFNLFHSSYEYLHVLVTTSGQFEKYCKTWPNHLIMALPEQDSLGLGQTYHLIQQFAQYNLQLNSAMQQYEGPSRVVWPMVVITSDSLVMWKKMEEGRSTDVSLSDVIRSLEQSADCLQYAAISLPQWTKKMEEETIPTDFETTHTPLTDYDLNHHFIMLNLTKTVGIHYHSYSFNSSQIDFNLQLQAAGLKTKLRSDFVFVKKHLPSGGNRYPSQPSIPSLYLDTEKLAISLHHDTSSLFPHPGPYLMEQFLLHKSSSLFPYAHCPKSPVFMVDNYVNLGRKTCIALVKSEQLCSDAFLSSKEVDKIQFGGLVLYLCEGRVASKQLQRLRFVPGACLCLVTRDCKSLVREVARLDLEERWKFRLRDEYQTACPDHLRPLFFLIGRFESQSNQSDPF